MRFALNGKRYDTEKMDEVSGGGETSVGVGITGIWVTRRTKRVFVATYSRWTTSSGESPNDQVYEAGPDEITSLAQRYDLDALRDLLPDDSD